MPTLRQALTGAVAGLFAALLLAAPAATVAAPIVHSTITGADGRDVLVVRPAPSGAAEIAVVDIAEGGEAIFANGGCGQDSFTRVYCTVGENGLTLNLGGGDDQVDVDPESRLAFRVTADGGAGADRLTGAPGTERLIGGDGDDLLDGRGGADALIGGSGRDVLNGDGEQTTGAGSGDDTVDARDGEVDTVACGPGSDRVIADADDVVAGDCETVERLAGGGPPGPGDGPGRGGAGEQPGGPAPGPGDGASRPGEGPGRGDGGGERLVVRPAAGSAVRLATALRRGLPLRVSGVAGRVSVRATVPAAVARRAGLKAPRGARRGAPVVVASGTATVRAGAVATVRLAFTRPARARLQRLRSLTLTVAAVGRQGGGKVTFRRWTAGRPAVVSGGEPGA